MKGILAMLFVTTAISCEKDQRVETKENIALTSEVVKAKEFVETRITDGFSLKSAGGDQSSIKIRARWENAKVTSNNHFVVVEAELRRWANLALSFKRAATRCINIRCREWWY